MSDMLIRGSMWGALYCYTPEVILDWRRLSVVFVDPWPLLLPLTSGFQIRPLFLSLYILWLGY